MIFKFIPFNVSKCGVFYTHGVSRLFINPILKKLNHLRQAIHFFLFMMHFSWFGLLCFIRRRRSWLLRQFLPFPLIIYDIIIVATIVNPMSRKHLKQLKSRMVQVMHR
ncbi:hypothetical protein HanIR_Chr09g0439991 [Helianthus annuus]|nr:hypothetical protein HanIR_Chr09g0439991 [Helianthus annuus]